MPGPALRNLTRPWGKGKNEGGKSRSEICTPFLVIALAKSHPFETMERGGRKGKVQRDRLPQILLVPVLLNGTIWLVAGSCNTSAVFVGRGEGKAKKRRGDYSRLPYVLLLASLEL